ncbi:MAG: hypothetical protein K1X88_32145 [Nannocystaceae bacterium]|nr:hypothetical protein [Nannocystaceae bacterium]
MAHPALIPAAIASTVWSTAIGVGWLLALDGRHGWATAVLWAVGQLAVLVGALASRGRALGSDLVVAVTAAWLGLGCGMIAIGVLTHAHWQQAALASIDLRGDLRDAVVQRVATEHASATAYLRSVLAPRALAPAVFVLPIAFVAAFAVDGRRRA